MSRAANSSTDQHYVPQLLLRGFATPKRRQVYVFDKQIEKVFRSSVRNLACERGFYDLEDEGDPKRLDRWLGRLEEYTAPIIKSIRGRRSLDHLHPAERKWIASFIAVQQVRTRHHRESRGYLNRQMADALREMGADPNKVENFRELTQAEVRRDSIADMPPTAFTLLPHLLNKAWILPVRGSGEDVLGRRPSGRTRQQSQPRRRSPGNAGPCRARDRGLSADQQRIDTWLPVSKYPGNVCRRQGANNSTGTGHGSSGRVS